MKYIELWKLFVIVIIICGILDIIRHTTYIDFNVMFVGLTVGSIVMGYWYLSIYFEKPCKDR